MDDRASEISLTQFTIDSPRSQRFNFVDETPVTAKGWVHQAKESKGIYIHIPFCFHKCHYCDFFSIANAEDQIEPFITRLVREIQYLSPFITNEINSIFIGGGTPTLIPVPQIQLLFDAINVCVPLAADYEWTIEANPETVTQEVAHVIANSGVNRVSIGAQSFNKELLSKLERWHEPENVGRAVQYFKDAGLDNLNLDLIYAIPTQTLDELNSDLDSVISLGPKHLSCYSLIYEPNTPLRKRLERGEVKRVSQEVEAMMFETVRNRLKAEGFDQYEISNFSKIGFECQHNIMYWKNENWWPLGPAAAGHINGTRWKNKSRLSEYMNSDSLPPLEEFEQLTRDLQLGETCMLGLRMTKGLGKKVVHTIIQDSPQQWRGPVIDAFIKEGYLAWLNDSLALTNEGQLFADTVISALLMEGDEITDISTL